MVPQSRTYVSLALIALVATTPLVGVAAASSGSVTAIIASPANGATFTRIGNVVFTDGSTHSSCPVNGWQWSFGDGSLSSLQSPSHHYAALGTYTVTLDVTGSCGATSQASVSISIQNIAPSATIGVTPQPATAGEPITLSSSGSRDLDGSILEYRFSVDGSPLAPTTSSSVSVGAPTLAGAHTVSLVVVDNEGALSAPSSMTLNVVAAELDAISVAGPDTMVVGTSAAFTPTGVDAYGNAVALDVSSFTHTAGLSPGTETASYTEDGVTGSKSVSVIADDLARIELVGVSELVAGTSTTFDLFGYDQYGNPLPLDESTLAFTAPTSAGPASVCYEEDGVSGCKTVTVLPDALDHILVTGPTTVVAGETTAFGLAGFDQYNNAVSLAEPSVDFSSTAAGPATVSYTESGVTGSLGITVVAAELAQIVVSGPATLVVNEVATYVLSGSDAFGNNVPLAQTSLEFTAPSTAGTYDVEYTESGVTGSTPVDVLADALGTIVVNGPANPVAGTTVTYTFSGTDAFGNPVALDPSSRAFAINTVAGLQSICETQNGVTGCLMVEVVPDALATIVVTGPTSLVVGTSADFALAGFDQYNNAVALAQSTLSYTAPTMAQTDIVSYTESGVTGTQLVDVVADALASISLSGPSFPVAGTTHEYAADGYDQYGNAVPLADPSPSFTAPTNAGPATFSYTEGAITGTIDVTVVHDALASITLSGPAQAEAGSMVMLLPSGYDQYGNAVPLSTYALFETAQTTVGVQSFSYTEGAITGSTTVSIVAGPLAQITVSGPATIAAGATQAYDLAGADQYGNVVPLSQATTDFTAPTSVGTATVSYSEGFVTGTLDVTVVPAALARIELSGPNTLVVGSTATYNLAGFDAYDNGVDLPDLSMSYTAPGTAGSYVASYTHAGVTGSMPVEVVADIPAYILVEGPTTLGVAETATYALSGFDIYGNEVTLAQSSLDYTAPTTMGPVDVCYAESGVQGCLAVEITAADLATIGVAGPTELVVGGTYAYALSGADQYGNAVPLAQTTLDFTAPTTPGAAVVSYTEQGVTGALDVSVVADALATITLDGPATLLIGRTATYTVSGADQFGNAVALDVASVDFTAPDTPGTYDVTYTEDGVTGTFAVEVTVPPVARIELTPASAVTNVHRAVTFTAKAYDADDVLIPNAPLTWSTDLGTVSSTGVFRSGSVGVANVTVTSGAVSATSVVSISNVLDVSIVLDGTDILLTGQALRGTVTVRYQDGAPVVGAVVAVTLHREGPIAILADEASSGTTNANGQYRFGIVPRAALPGDYTVTAQAQTSGNAGSDTESFTLDPLATSGAAMSVPVAPATGGRGAKSQ